MELTKAQQAVINQVEAYVKKGEINAQITATIGVVEKLESLGYISDYSVVYQETGKRICDLLVTVNTNHSYWKRYFKKAKINHTNWIPPIAE